MAIPWLRPCSQLPPGSGPEQCQRGTPAPAAVLLIIEHSMSGPLYTPRLHYYPFAALQARRSSPVCFGAQVLIPYNHSEMTLENGGGPVPLIRRIKKTFIMAGVSVGPSGGIQ